MQGTIKSYSAEKGFGFVDGKDGESYFLHKSQLADKSQASQLVIGLQVEFDPTPTPKGMQANKVSVLPTLIGKAMPEFSLSRKGEPRDTEVVWEQSIVWPRCYSDFRAAETAVADFAKAVCANAVLNFRIQKETRSEGNYLFTVGRPVFTLAVVIKNVQAKDQAEVEFLEQKLAIALSRAADANEVLADMERPVEFPKSSTSASKVFALIVIAFIVYTLFNSRIISLN